MPLYLDYYYGNEAEQYSFYRIPKMLFTDERFKDITVEAKVLYGLMLDRMALSVKNNWLDEEGRVYIIFTISEITEKLNCAEQKAGKLLKELDAEKGAGLIERKRRGLGKPNIIYVKNFLDKNSRTDPGGMAEMQRSSFMNHENHHSGEMKITDPEPLKSWSVNSENHNSGEVKITGQEPLKSQSNKTYINNTDFNNTYLSSIFQYDSYMPEGQTPDQTEEMDRYRRRIKENINYDALIQDRPFDTARIDELAELIAEVCSCGRNTVRINREDVPADMVKKRFMELNDGHIRYVLDSLERNTSYIGNIRAYIISTLFNAPVTISHYYTNLVNHDPACRSESG